MERLGGSVARPFFHSGAGSPAVIVPGTLLFLFAASTLDHKFDLIEQNRLRPGSRVVTTRAEWNAWVQDEAPAGVRRTRIDLGANRVMAYATVDFLKLHRAAGQRPNWFLSTLLEGERPVAVIARVQSGGGRARVDLERVEVSGVAVEGRALDFLVQEYVIRAYPEAKVSQWFPLSYRMDHFEIESSGVTVVIKR